MSENVLAVTPETTRPLVIAASPIRVRPEMFTVREAVVVGRALPSRKASAAAPNSDRKVAKRP